MVTRETWLTAEGLDEFEREDALYPEPLATTAWHERRIRIARGRLFHDKDRDDVRRQVVDAGIEPGSALIENLAHGPPFRV